MKRARRFLPHRLRCASRRTAQALDVNRPDVQEYVNELVKEQGLDADYVLAMLEGTETQQSILDAMARPAENAPSPGASTARSSSRRSASRPASSSGRRTRRG